MKRGKRYQAKGLLHAKRFTMKPGDCRLCHKALPIPRRNAMRLCEECSASRLEERRQAKNRAAQAREAAKLANRPKIEVICQHRDKDDKDGPVCGIKFEPIPRVSDKDGINRGVHPNQQYCPKHSTPAARLHRNSTREQRRVWALDHRHRNLPKVREKQRKAAKKQREKVAAILGGHDVEIAALRVQVEEGKAAAAKLEKLEKGRQPVLIGPDRMVMNKPGPKLDVERAKYVCELRDKSGLKWDAILERVQVRFHCHTSVPALKELRRRYLALQKKDTN